MASNDEIHRAVVKIGTDVEVIKSRLEVIELHRRAIDGHNGDPGLKRRVDRLETFASSIKRHAWALWTILLGLGGTLATTLIGRLVDR